MLWSCGRRRLGLLGPRPVLEVAVTLDGLQHTLQHEAGGDAGDQAGGGGEGGRRGSGGGGGGAWEMYRKTRSATLRPRFTLVNHSNYHLQAVQQV